MPQKRTRRSSRRGPKQARATAKFNSARRHPGKQTDALCPIVGIGGSAGGFEATMELLRSLPATNGMAFVVVQHLDPRHASRLVSLLGRVTAISEFGPIA